MAAAAPGTDVLQPRQRRHSMEEPPYMSELRVVLLGNSWSERTSLGNFILGETQFSTEGDPDCCVRVRGQLKEKQIVVINTPDLLHPDICADKLREHVENCVSLSAPGPHVFLLVLQPEDFTEQHQQRLCRVLQLFSHRSFHHSLVLISTPRQESSGFMEKYRNHPPLRALITECRYRYVWKKNLEHPELLTRLGQIVKENRGDHLSRDGSEDAASATTPKCERMKPALNLVLCGRRRTTKTSAAKSILGRTELHSVSGSSEGAKGHGEVCGRQVSLVELPALYGEPQEAVMEESLRCISLCDPDGVHAFILVLPVGPLTDEDKGELQTIQNTFSSAVNDFTMILFTVESDPTAPAVLNFIKENKDVQELCQSCGGRSVVLNIKDRQQISELLDTVETMRAEGSRCFTKDMFTRAQMNKVIQQENRNTKLRAELQKQRSDPGHPSREPLRMVLIGKSGSGKSATANTILGKKHFKPRITPKPPTTSCERATGEIDGRPVAVVSTPALFNTTLSEDDAQHELQKCITMLAPGPHVFLLLLQIGNFTEEEKESMELIRRVFGKKAQDFTIIVFTRGDELEDQTFESYIDGCQDFVKTLVRDCGGRYQVFSNKDDANRTQVSELLTKIETMVTDNGGSCYTTEMFLLTREALQQEVERIMKNQQPAKVDEGKHEEMIRQLEAQICEVDQRSKQHEEQNQLRVNEDLRKLRRELDDMKQKQEKKKKKCSVM